MRSISAGLVALALLAVPDADRAGCGNIDERYTAAVAAVVDALRGYERCVVAGDRREGKGVDCAAEMQALDDAHDDFADVVGDIRACR